MNYLKFCPRQAQRVHMIHFIPVIGVLIQQLRWEEKDEKPHKHHLCRLYSFILLNIKTSPILLGRDRWN